ncbi:MAG: Multifunctional fusion protein [Limosilactobacillus fermentum]|jgi:imidazole glycerol-phosphate synthase subunit HisF
MLTKRIIPCLDVTDGRVKKGVNFVNLVDVGDPVAIARRYQEQGADELVFLDITATNQGRQATVDMVAAVSRQVFMPLTVGGGIRSVEDMRALLLAGADKVSLNSSAVADPDLISAGARLFGNQCLVTAIDVKTDPATGQKMVYTHGGTKPTGLEALAWAKQVVSLGSGELLVTSMDKDGTQDGYDTAFYKELTAAVDVPVIASGGAGKIDDFADVFLNSGVTGALAASVFHFQQLTIAQVKEDLIKKGVPVRWKPDFTKGLLTTVVVDATTKDVLMVAWMNEASYRLTKQTGETWFWSRSRQGLWHKGATSGNTQVVKGMWLDCDQDTLLVKVDPAGPACHTGARSCFFNQVQGKED